MRPDVKYVQTEIDRIGGLPQIDATIELIEEHIVKEHLRSDGEIFTSKIERLAQWIPEENEINKLVTSMFTTVLTESYLTYQALVGAHCHAIPMPNEKDRIQTMAECVAMMCLADAIDITCNQGEYHLITPKFKLGNIPVVDRHGTIYDRPQPVEQNRDPIQGSMLLGGALNHHEGNVCLDHINRLNAIPMALNREFLTKYPEEPKNPEKLDTYEKQERWRNFTDESKKRYAHAICSAEKLYLKHKTDTRGRTYAMGYYINYQGSAYKKAMLDFADKEVLDSSVAFPK